MFLTFDRNYDRLEVKIFTIAKNLFRRTLGTIANEILSRVLETRVTNDPGGTGVNHARRENVLVLRSISSLLDRRP